MTKEEKKQPKGKATAPLAPKHHKAEDKPKSKGNTAKAAKATEQKPKAEKKVKEPRFCACGCGQTTGSAFAPGHDSKVKSAFLKIDRGEMKQTELPTKEMKALYKRYAEDRRKPLKEIAAA